MVNLDALDATCKNISRAGFKLLGWTYLSSTMTRISGAEGPSDDIGHIIFSAGMHYLGASTVLYLSSEDLIRRFDASYSKEGSAEMVAALGLMAVPLVTNIISGIYEKIRSSYLKNKNILEE